MCFNGKCIIDKSFNPADNSYERISRNEQCYKEEAGYFSERVSYLFDDLAFNNFKTIT